MSQLLLLPDPRPLDQRLGRKFFLNAPRRPGVYLMRDVTDKILYIGKAKDLKQRLNHYRNANPDRMPRRHLRLVREVARIEFQFSPDETAALDQEKKLIRAHRPKFNRAGVWEGPRKFVIWRLEAGRLEIGVAEVPEPSWRRCGPLGANAHHLQKSLSRLFWLVAHPDKWVSELPAGWMRNEAILSISIGGQNTADEISALLEAYFWESSEFFLTWLAEKLLQRENPFERQIIQDDLQNLKSFSPKLSCQAAQFPLL
jgi:predicted GIY-YIG superfamily endonuclease